MILCGDPQRRRDLLVEGELVRDVVPRHGYAKRTDDFAPRPRRRRAAFLPRPAPEHQRALGALREGLEQTGFADPSIALDQRGTASPALGGGHEAAEQLQLPASPDDHHYPSLASPKSATSAPSSSLPCSPKATARCTD